jgi:hypothetical protein
MSQRLNSKPEVTSGASFEADLPLSARIEQQNF